MPFQSKIQRVGTIKEFLSGELAIKRFNHQAAKQGIKAALTVAGGTILLTFTGIDFASAAAVSGMVHEKITNAFMPLVELVKGLSYPIALVIMSGGALMIMIGSKEKGYSMIQNASIGYILVQMMPLLMKLLVEIAKAM
jgi:Type IV secretion system pilin